MAVTLYERARSRTTVTDIAAGSVTFEYIAKAVAPFDVSDDVDVYNAAVADTDLRYGCMLRRGITCTPLGGPWWDVEVRYGHDTGDYLSPGAGAVLGYEFSFDTTGGTVHVTQSLLTADSVKHGIVPGSRTGTDGALTADSNELFGSGFSSSDVGRVIVCPSSSRTFNDGTTIAGSATLLSDAIANFTADDVGRALSGIGIPSNTTVAEFVDANQVTMSRAATVSQSAILGNAASVRITFPGLPAGTIISSFVGTGQVILSKAATVSGSLLTYTLEGFPALNFKRAIGVTKDGIAGTDKVAPKMEFQITRDFSGVTLAYLNVLHALTGKVNADTWFGFAPGDLLFMGAAGTPSQNNEGCGHVVRIVFKFSASASQTNIDVVPPDDAGNPLLRIGLKRGWEYLWVYYVETVDRSTIPSGFRASRPDAAYVEQIYEYGDFTSLLLGG